MDHSTNFNCVRVSFCKLCEVVAGQRYTQTLSRNQRQKQIGMCKQPPEVRRRLCESVSTFLHICFSQDFGSQEEVEKVKCPQKSPRSYEQLQQYESNCSLGGWRRKYFQTGTWLVYISRDAASGPYSLQTQCSLTTFDFIERQWYLPLILKSTLGRRSWNGVPSLVSVLCKSYKFLDMVVRTCPDPQLMTACSYTAKCIGQRLGKVGGQV